MSSEGSGVRDNEDDHLCVRGIYRLPVRLNL